MPGSGSVAESRAVNAISSVVLFGGQGKNKIVHVCIGQQRYEIKHVSGTINNFRLGHPSVAPKL